MCVWLFPPFFFGLSWARVCVCVYVHRVYLSSFPRPQTAHTFDNKSRTRFLFCDKVPINYRNSPHKKIVCYRIQCMYNLYGIFVSQCSLCCRCCHSTRAQWALTHTHTQAKRTTTTNKTRVTQRMRTPNKKKNWCIHLTAATKMKKDRVFVPWRDHPTRPAIPAQDETK